MNALALGALVAAAAIAHAAELAAPAPEPELALASERGLQGGRVGYNFGTNTLYRAVGQDQRRRQLLEDDHEGEAEAEPEAAGAGPETEPEFALAINRSLQGGTAGRYEGEEWNQDHKPYGTKPHRHLLLEDDHHGDDHDGEAEAEPAAAAPGPELDLATSRSSITLDPATLSRPELRYGSYVGQIGKK